MKPFFVYMLQLRDRSYYVGQTDDLERRVAQHQDGTFGGHTARLRPLLLVWSTEVETRDEALVLEQRLKGWSRAKKETLIASDWTGLKRAARGPNRSERAPKGGPSTPRGPAAHATLGANGSEPRRGAGPEQAEGLGAKETFSPFTPSVGPKGRSRGAGLEAGNEHD